MKKSLVIVVCLVLLFLSMINIIHNNTSYYSTEVSNDKPVLYFYPEQDNTEISAELKLDGKFTSVYPNFNLSDDGSVSGWSFTADRDGTLTVKNLYKESNNVKVKERQYKYLFWEGLTSEYTITDGYCVAKDDTVTFLETELGKRGLNSSEINDFITYWLPKLNEHPYNIISFNTEQYENKCNLYVNPKPDTIIRVFMTYKGCEEYTQVPEPAVIETPKRVGFTVVEWGGALGN